MSEDSDNLNDDLDREEFDDAEIEKELEDALSEGDEKKEQQQLLGNRFSIKTRRAIEDHLEQRRLRHELDYLLDDDAENDSKK